MGSKRVYVLGISLLVLEAVTSVVEPYPIAYLIDFLQGARPNLRELGAPTVLGSVRTETILLLTLAIIAIAVVNSAADSFTEVCMARGGRSLGYSIRVKMYSHLQRLPLAYHDKKRTGDVLTRVTGDVLVIEDFIVKSLSNILGSVMVLVGSFVFLLFQSWSVALVAVVVIPILAVASNHYSRRIKVASKTQRDREGDLASTAQEMLSSIRLVQSYGRGTVDLQKFSTQTGQSMFASLKAANIQAEFSFVVALIEALAIVNVIWLGLWLMDHGVVSIGTLVLFILLLQNMFKPARKIVSEWYKIGNVFASVERVDDLLNREVSVADSPDAVPAPTLQGRLSLRHVSFTYPAEHADGSKAVGRPPALRDIDFDVAPGEVVALVGFSGAGKSTIAQLVPRLYDPDSGAVLVDGLDVRTLTLASLRRQVSLVLQETVLLSGTVAENIGYGVDEASQQGIEGAARMANAHDFIMELPDGYETALGERGSTLSGGQRQRIAIARAFMRGAPILILDEPTTGLDAESAQTVVGALQNLMRDTTTIVISHDYGLVRCADRVLVVADGRLVESGTPDALMRRRGHFAELQIGRAGATAGAPESRAGAEPPVAPPPVHPPVTQPAPSPVTLSEELTTRLPGLLTALDEDQMAQRIGESLVGSAHRVSGVSAGSFWLREDGSCSLRYTVRLFDADGVETEQVLLARVHQDESASRAYLEGRIRPLLGGRRPAGGPWAAPAAVVPEAGLALHVFPSDPDLPTLRQALSPRTVATLVRCPPTAAAPTIEVVHHPRAGACVLRYGIPGRDGDADGGRTLYGKVYADPGRGEAVESFLRALGRGRGEAEGWAGSFPRPVLYAPSLRLLVTEALPGEPAIPRLLASVLSRTLTAEVWHETAALRTAVRAAGEALARLHGSDLATAPVHTAEAEQCTLRHTLELVAQSWPETARRLLGSSASLLVEPPDAPGLVLSHGDFTPSQVLLDGSSAAVVDLDTLCWADPALDLGRFLAHLELLAAKHGGVPGLGLVRDLADAFLTEYGAVTPETASAAAAVERIAFYRDATLTRSALNASLQLKAYRVALALSLLESSPTRRVDQ
jgi:ABC-type multidrug transport system fused ATPase/permease subunit